MKSKPTKSGVIVFACRFAVIFILLILPWPGWNASYGQYFRNFAGLAFSRDEGRQIVLFTANDGYPKTTPLDTRISLGNRELLDANGKERMKTSGMDSRSIGWVPTALTLSLIAATPIPWWRRFWAVAGGLVLIHVYILFCLQTWIWNNAPEVSLTSLSPFWKGVADNLEYTFMQQLGASFSVPVLIWILVTFRGQDVPALSREKQKSDSLKVSSGSSLDPAKCQAASAVQPT